MEDVGENILAKNARWDFGKEVAPHFDEHVQKSVPYYLEGHDLVLKLSDFFIHSDSIAYELGTSTGSLLEKLAKRHSTGSRWIGIDSEEAMIDQAKIRFDGKPLNIELRQENIIHSQLEKSDMIVSYYTLQFIPPRHRQEMINKIYESLNWGGAFILFEKVRGADARFQDIFTTLYQDYKLEQGYSAQEIVAKTRSLKGVLEPFSSQGNSDLLKRAGFCDINSTFKYLCFEGLLCIK